MNKEKLIKHGNNAKLDKKDKKILKALDKDARASIASISRKTGIQRDSVHYRINRMKRSGTIRFFHTVLNPSILGCEIYSYVNFTLHNLTPEKEKSMIEHFENNPHIVYAAKTTGKWDFMINIAAEDLNQFDKVLNKLRVDFADIIKEYESSPIIQEYKYDYMVDLIE